MRLSNELKNYQMSIKFSKQIAGKNIVITGGAGFIGSTLVGELVESNNVTVFDNFSRNSIKDKSFNGHHNLRIIEGDVLDYNAVAQAVKGANYIIHCAAIAGIDTVIKSPIRTMRVNMVGSANVLEAASHEKNLDRVICFSTSEVFGAHAFRSTEKDHMVTGSVGEARWTYAVSKLSEEHLAMAYYNELKLPVAVLRPFNVYGPGQVGEGALSIFIQNALKNKKIVIHGDGTQIRAWCYVDDMIEGTILAMVNPRAIGESFNIGNQRAVTTIYGLASAVVRILGSSSAIEFVPRDSVDVEIRIPSVQKSREILDFEAKVDLEEGIRLTAAFYEKQ